jgi:hypothetical protein
MLIKHPKYIVLLVVFLCLIVAGVFLADFKTDTFTDETKIASKSNITVTGGQVKLSTCKDNGTACSAGSECCAGNCIDSVCCDSDCTGLCKTCKSDDGGTAGTCHNTNDNYDLDSECAGPSYNACSNQYTMIGPDGYCDGSGACDTNDTTAYVSAGDVCYQVTSQDKIQAATPIVVLGLKTVTVTTIGTSVTQPMTVLMTNIM